MIECPNCDDKIPYQTFITSHYRDCVEQKIQCSQCQKMVELHFLDIHTHNYCTERQCPFTCDKNITV